jgi:hypothetical protein
VVLKTSGLIGDKALWMGVWTVTWIPYFLVLNVHVDCADVGHKRAGVHAGKRFEDLTLVSHMDFRFHQWFYFLLITAHREPSVLRK